MPTRCGPRPSALCTTRYVPPTLGANPAGVRSWTITSRPTCSRRTWAVDVFFVSSFVAQRDTNRGTIAYFTRPIAWLHRLTCDEAPEEPKNVKTDKVLKLDCNININTNYMLTGIKDVSAGCSESSYSGSLVAKPRVFFSCRLRRALIRRSKRLRLRLVGRRFTPSEFPRF
jgi:hypothetical protein